VLTDRISVQVPGAANVLFNKGLHFFSGTLEPGDVKRLDWNLLREDLSLPSAVLYEDKLAHNLNWMERFVSAYGAKLAPHGKTTMSPQLFARQLQHGAWGITLSTAQQTLAAWQHGVRRVLMANQLVGKENMRIISSLLDDPGFEYYCLIDSADQLNRLGAFFSARGQRLPVLVELGVTGGRTGVRDEEQLKAVLDALSHWRNVLVLSGVEIFEGVLADESAIRAFLQRAIDVTRKLVRDKRFQRTPALISGAGSAWYDLVAESFSAAGFGSGIEIILRPGCYITHDAGSYREAQARILATNPVAHRMQSGLVPALHVWAYVHSRREPGMAIIGLGKRDAAFDAGFPIPALHFRPEEPLPKPAPEHWSLVRMMDQHAFLQISAQDDLLVGDMLAFDISHPCLTFDKWRAMPILDAEYAVVDVIQTWF